MSSPSTPRSPVCTWRSSSSRRSSDMLASDACGLDPTYAARACVYEHAQHLIEILTDMDYRASVNVPGDRAFEGLERVAPRPATLPRTPSTYGAPAAARPAAEGGRPGGAC